VYSKDKQSLAKNVIFWGGGLIWGLTNEWPKATSERGVGGKSICFEMVHFGAKVTYAVHHQWFSGVYSETTDLRLINFLVTILGVGI